MLLHLSFKKIIQFVLKVVIWPLKAKKWPCPSLPFWFLHTVQKLGIELSFSSSLDTLKDSRQNETLLGYHPTFSVEGHPYHPVQYSEQFPTRWISSQFWSSVLVYFFSANLSAESQLSWMLLKRIWDLIIRSMLCWLLSHLSLTINGPENVPLLWSQPKRKPIFKLSSSAPLQLRSKEEEVEM